MFCGSAIGDGADPTGSLTFDGRHALRHDYKGGANGYGTLFKMTPPRRTTPCGQDCAHSFTDGKDGALPAVWPGHRSRRHHPLRHHEPWWD
jgi:hypothetical protein